MFAVFEAAGSDIAELKIPLVKNIGAPKRVTPEVIDTLKPQLRPGDVFITRHDDAMSNLFLPGFWPHGALYIGEVEARKSQNIAEVFDGVRRSEEEGINMLEAKKAGRKCLSAEDFLNQAVAMDWFEPVIIYGIGGNDRFEDTTKVQRILSQTFDSAFT